MRKLYWLMIIVVAIVTVMLGEVCYADSKGKANGSCPSPDQTGSSDNGLYVLTDINTGANGLEDHILLHPCGNCGVDGGAVPAFVCSGVFPNVPDVEHPLEGCPFEVTFAYKTRAGASTFDPVLGQPHYNLVVYSNVSIDPGEFCALDYARPLGGFPTAVSCIGPDGVPWYVYEDAPGGATLPCP